VRQTKNEQLPASAPNRQPHAIDQYQKSDKNPKLGLGRTLAEQDAAERELRRARKGRRAALEAQLADLCEAEGPLG
jgi:hypothetical protein